jgi:hypothetical protein
MKSQSLVEAIADHGITSEGFDAVAGVIKNVKLAGFTSKRGRSYAPAALKEALPMYEGAAVNIDHTENGTPPLNSRFGIVKAARFVEGDGVRGDIHFNPTHPMVNQVGWLAKNAPTKIGMSHHAYGLMGGGGSVVTKLTRVRSVDLVTDPATTDGLYEDEGEGDDGSSSSETKPPSGGRKTMELKDLKLSELKESRPDLVEAIKTELKESEGSKSAAEELKTLREKNAKLEREKVINTKLEESELPESAITDRFRTLLLEAKDDAAVDELIEDRKAIAGKSATKSKGGATSREASLTEDEGKGKSKGKEKTVVGGMPVPTDGKSLAANLKRL